jgi:hypothetical protein
MTSTYANDPRVAAYDTGPDTGTPRGYTVLREDGTDLQILPTDTFGWTVCHGPNLDYVPTTDGGFAIGYPNPDAAITDALGDHPATEPQAAPGLADTSDDTDGM